MQLLLHFFITFRIMVLLICIILCLCFHVSWYWFLCSCVIHSFHKVIHRIMLYYYTSIMQKIWNIAIIFITNGNKKWKYFSATPKTSFFKKFFHSPPTSVLSNSPQSHGCVFVVFCQAPPKEHIVFLLGGCHVWWTHTNTSRVCVHASETPLVKGVFLCGVRLAWCACGGSLWQHDCCHRVVHRKHVCVCGGVWSLSVQHSTLVGSVFPW